MPGNFIFSGVKTQFSMFSILQFHLYANFLCAFYFINRTVQQQ